MGNNGSYPYIGNISAETEVSCNVEVLISSPIYFYILYMPMLFSMMVKMVGARIN